MPCTDHKLAVGRAGPIALQHMHALCTCADPMLGGALREHADCVVFFVGVVQWWCEQAGFAALALCLRLHLVGECFSVPLAVCRAVSREGW